ncbi:hypothetical protein TNCV_2173861 [Trichonephila clavipes]|nr:hypothetical protein TNCV_2173861 [Trichonephila clavipes]
MTPTHRTEIFAIGRSSDCGEATSSKDQLLLDKIQSLEEQICQLSILHKSRTKERNIGFVLNFEVLGNVSTPKENIAIFTSVSLLDANLKNAVRHVHGMEYGKLQPAVNIVINSAAEDYKACRKFRLFVKDRTTNLHFLVDSGADCSIIPAKSKNK